MDFWPAVRLRSNFGSPRKESLPEEKHDTGVRCMNN
jgi:hypothetical protein